MTQLNNELNVDDRLNRILDKIKSIGLKSLDKKELEFLNSFKNGDEENFNKKLYNNLYLTLKDKILFLHSAW